MRDMWFFGEYKHIITCFCIKSGFRHFRQFGDGSKKRQSDTNKFPKMIKKRLFLWFEGIEKTNHSKYNKE